MESERWRRVEEAYHRVLARPPDQRAAVLEESFSDDPGLREEVESLLEAREGAGDFLSPADLHDHIADLGASTGPAPARVLGPYEILSPLGAGGMGEVYRARDTRLHREVALKILHAHLTHDPARVSRFQVEAQAASALNHPNIATIFDMGEENGIRFIAAELVHGVNLRERMARGKLPLDEAIRITIQCAAALEEAHRASIVHRDIKPENVMLRPDGGVKLVDFGLARITTEEPAATSLTQSGVVLGTPRYMSPEQARGHKPDARSDIFSLGAVLYEMVAGRPAFAGATSAEVFAELLRPEPPPSAGGVLDRILSRALQKDPAARYKTMQEFASDLRKVDPTEKRALWAGLSARLPGGRRARQGLQLLVVAGLAVIAWIVSREFLWRPASGVTLNVVALTTFSGPKDYPALSPDGTRVAFSWTPSTQSARHIYVKPAGPGEPVQLTNSLEDDKLAAWSPDGRQIAFCRSPRGSDYDLREQVGSALYIVPSVGGAERKIAQGCEGASWSADARTLALARVPDGRPKSGGIDLLSLESGERRNLTTSQEDILPVFSPNGNWIAFTRVFPGRGREIFVVPAAGGPARQLTFDGEQTDGATWTGDSREILFSSPRNRAQGELWRISVTGGSPRPLAAALRNASFPSVSPRSTRLVFTESWTDTNIHLRTGSGFVEPRMRGRFGEPAAVIASTRAEHSPAFSPDGERVAFASNQSGNEEIWVSRRNGSEAIQLTVFGKDSAGSPRWSPDGLQIAFDVWASGESAVFVVNSRGGEPRRLTQERGDNSMPAWSPDGRWIYFTSRRSGTREIWKMPAAGGAATQVTHSGASEAHPAPDGNTIYFSKSTAAGCCEIWSMPAAGGPEQPVWELQKYNPISRSWNVLHHGIYFLPKRNGPPHIVRFLSFATHEVSDVVRLVKEPGWIFPALAMSADGRHLLTVQIDREVNDLVMIDNFH